MEKRLRVRLIVTVFCSLTVLLGLILGVSVQTRRFQQEASADVYLNIILDNDGVLPKESKDSLESEAEGIYDARFFVVWLDENGVVTSTNLDQTTTVDEEQAASFAHLAYTSGRDSGNFGDYRYLVRENSDGSYIIGFLDRSRQNSDTQLSVVNESLVMFGGVLVVTGILILISRRIVAPLVKAQESQQQFVIDAGHDLRTPVSIISADADVLAMDIGEDNEWLHDIKHQVGVMSDLTESLIVLSRAASADGRKGDVVDLSSLVGEEASSFKSRSLLEGHEVRSTVESGVSVRGNAQYLSRMVGALIDNAMKYSSEGGAIDVRLTARRRQAQLEVSNPVEGVDPDEVNRWFDRFYQSDQSRTHRKGGYGIGLSMVQAVVTSHGGKVKATAAPDGRSVTFTVTIPTTKGDVK